METSSLRAVTATEKTSSLAQAPSVPANFAANLLLPTSREYLFISM